MIQFNAIFWTFLLHADNRELSLDFTGPYFMESTTLFSAAPKVKNRAFAVFSPFTTRVRKNGALWVTRLSAPGATVAGGSLTVSSGDSVFIITTWRGYTRHRIDGENFVMILLLMVYINLKFYKRFIVLLVWLWINNTNKLCTSLFLPNINIEHLDEWNCYTWIYFKFHIRLN